MKSSIKISQTYLRRLLSNIDKINSIPDDDVHADVQLKAENESIHIYSHVPPAFVSHVISNGDKIKVNVNESGKMSFNIETLSDIVQKAEEGMFEIGFEDDGYHIVTPGNTSISPVKFDLPKHTDSLLKEPLNTGELHVVDTLPRAELKSCLSTMSVIAEYVHIVVEDGGNLVISIENKVTGDAELVRPISNSEINSMSQYYLVRPLMQFASTIVDADTISVLVSETGNVCFRADVDSWRSEVYLSNKEDQYLDIYLNL